MHAPHRTKPHPAHRSGLGGTLCNDSESIETNLNVSGRGRCVVLLRRHQEATRRYFGWLPHERAKVRRRVEAGSSRNDQMKRHLPNCCRMDSDKASTASSKFDVGVFFTFTKANLQQLAGEILASASQIKLVRECAKVKRSNPDLSPVQSYIPAHCKRMARA